jgi:predicted ATPase
MTQDTLLESLEEAESACLIELVSHPALHYQFTHALIRETLYDELTTARRLRLHRRIEEVLESVYAANLEPHLVQLAYHFFDSRILGDADKSIGYCVRAAARADSILAYEEAAHHYEMALQALELKNASDEERRCRLLLALGEARTKTRDTVRASVSRGTEGRSSWLIYKVQNG